MQVKANVDQIGPSTANGSARSHHVTIDRPETKGGADQGAMGGELLLVSLGGCFMSNLLEAIRTREASVSDVKIDITGTAEGSPSRFTAVHMAISADYDNRDEMEKLVTISERSCLVANTLKRALDVTLSIS